MGIYEAMGLGIVYLVTGTFISILIYKCVQKHL